MTICLFCLSIYHYILDTNNSDESTLKSPHHYGYIFDPAVISRLWLVEFSRKLASTPVKIPVVNLTEPFSPSSGVNVWDVFSPEISCPDIERVGNIGDGKILHIL